MRLSIRPLTLDDVPELLTLRLRNREHYTPLEPLRADPDAGYTADSITEMVLADRKARAADAAYGFGVFVDGTLVGRVALSNVVRAAWQNCTLGYYIDREQSGQGFGTEAVRQVVTFAFEEAGLHRVQAAVMPRNVASARVLKKAGFRYEGHAPGYLQINGLWEPHDLYATTPTDPGQKRAG